MKNKMQNLAKDESEMVFNKKMSRKEAIKKTGLVAVSAATMMMLAGSPMKAHAGSTAPPTMPGWPS
jgi:hypothetical protein